MRIVVAILAVTFIVLLTFAYGNSKRQDKNTTSSNNKTSENNQKSNSSSQSQNSTSSDNSTQNKTKPNTSSPTPPPNPQPTSPTTPIPTTGPSFVEIPLTIITLLTIIYFRTRRTLKLYKATEIR